MNDKPESRWVEWVSDREPPKIHFSGRAYTFSKKRSFGYRRIEYIYNGSVKSLIYDYSKDLRPFNPLDERTAETIFWQTVTRRAKAVREFLVRLPAEEEDEKAQELLNKVIDAAMTERSDEPLTPERIKELDSERSERARTGRRKKVITITEESAPQ